MKLIQQLDWFTKNIRYKDINHTYVWRDTQERMTSVTTLLKKYSPEFRSKYWRMYKALQASGYDVKSDASRGVKKDHIVINGASTLYTDVLSGQSGVTLTTTPADLSREWKYKSLVGTSRGTIIHNYLEHLWQGKVFPAMEWANIIRPNDSQSYAESLHILRNQADKFMDDHKHLIPIKLEQIVGCPDLGVAGQIDAILWDPQLDEYYLYDYKTDKKIEYGSPFDNLKVPLDGLDACNFNKYSLQIGIYKFLIERYTDIRITDCRIIWFNQFNLNYQSIKLRNLDEHVRDVLLHHANIFNNGNNTTGYIQRQKSN